MPSINVIVAGIADPQAEDPTLAAAAALARRTGAALHVVHAYPFPLALAITPGMEVLDPGAAEQYAEAVRARFEGAVLKRCGAGAAVAHAVHGPADRAILDAARTHQADLVMVGATRRGRLARALLGTTAQHVLRGASVPVLVTSGAEVTAARVLLTTDLSRSSESVHDRALELLESLGGAALGELRTLLVVMEGLQPPPLSPGVIERSAAAELDGFLAERRPHARTPEPVLRFGLPAAEIVAETERWGADLLVLGTHNRPTVPRLLLGSVAEAALRHVTCTVLVIPPERTAAEAPAARVEVAALTV